MTKNQVAQADNADDNDCEGEDVCPDCERPVDDTMSSGELFAARVCRINEILTQMLPWDQGSAIALLAAEHLGTMVKAASRQTIRDQIVQLIDEGTADVLERIEESRLPPNVEQKLALMPHVSGSIN